MPRLLAGSAARPVPCAQIGVRAVKAHALNKRHREDSALATKLDASLWHVKNRSSSADSEPRSARKDQIQRGTPLAEAPILQRSK